MSRHRKISFPDLLNHSQWPAAQAVLTRLKESGHEALLAGGAVRDLLLNRRPGDLDIATSARPEQVEALFSRTVAVGRSFGVIRVLSGDDSLEVATYREDLEYRDGRRPEGVRFTSREEDGKRRDFTVNALFYDPLEEILYDDVNGEKDLQDRILRCVGSPDLRFREDELRRLRLIRFVSQLGFRIEGETWRALQFGLEGLQRVSRERVTEEIGKMWKGAFLQQAFDLFLRSGLAVQVDPEWENLQKKGVFDSTPADIWNLPRHHDNEAWAHYFSFFFTADFDLRKRFQNFRLSSEIQKWILQVHQGYQKAASVPQQKFGEQRWFFAQPGFSLGFLYAIYKSLAESERPRLLKLLRDFELKGPLPPALVNGRSLQQKWGSRFQGPALGQILQEIFLEQLDQGWTKEDQVWLWLSQKLNS